MPQWDLAAVVVAILAVALAMSPAASSFIWGLCRVLLRAMWPASARCERLGWDDIKEGVLHRCSSPKENCQHIGTYGTTTSWDVTIGSLFTTIPRGNFVKKPKQLHFSTKYARTDTETLKALLVMLNPPHAERQNPVDRLSGS